MKRAEDSLRVLWDHIKFNNIWIIGFPEEKKKGCEKKFWRNYSWNFTQNEKRNSQASPRGPKSPIQDKPKEKHTKRHTNQTNKDQTQRAAREKQQVTYKGNPIILTADLSTKLCRPEENRRIYLKYWKGKIYNQDYCIQQGSHSKLMEKSKVFKTSKS